MTPALTLQQVEAMAPDDASLRQARRLGEARRWSGLGRRGAAIWGTIQGSGKRRPIDNARKSGHNIFGVAWETIFATNVEFIPTVVRLLVRLYLTEVLFIAPSVAAQLTTPESTLGTESGW